MDKDLNIPDTPFIPERKHILLDNPTTRMEDGKKTWAIFYKLDWRIAKGYNLGEAYQQLYNRFENK